MEKIIPRDLNISLSNDAIFKEYYSKPNNLSILLSLILNENINPNDIIYETSEIIVSSKCKKPRVDLRVSILNELNIDLEMQNTKEKYFKERTVYYLASMIMNSIQEGKNYHSNENYLGIWLMNTNIALFDNNSYYEEYIIYGKISKEEIIKDKYKILIIDLKKLNLCDNIELREYLSMIESKDNILKNLDSTSTLIKEEAVKMDDYLKSNEAFTIALNTLKSELDYNTAIISAKEEGIEEGFGKGVAQNKKEVIFNLYQMGLELEVIAKAVNLSIDEVKKILENK